MSCVLVKPQGLLTDLLWQAPLKAYYPATGIPRAMVIAGKAYWLPVYTFSSEVQFGQRVALMGMAVMQ